LCDFCGRVYCDILSIFLIPQFCLFLRHQTMDKVQKHNSFKTEADAYSCSVLRHHFVKFRTKLIISPLKM
jgi:hypothetical protein